MSTEEKKGIGNSVFVALGALILILVFGISYLFLAGLPKKDQITEPRAVPSSGAPVEKYPADIKIDSGLNKAIETDDFASCEELADDYSKTICVNNIALNSAKEKLDISFCQKLDDKLVSIKECERSVVMEKSVKDGDVSVCGLAKNNDSKTECVNDYYIVSAYEKNDASLCKNLLDAEKNRYCLNKVVLKDWDIAGRPKEFDCAKLVGADEVGDCRDFYDRVNNNDFLRMDCLKYRSIIFHAICERAQMTHGVK